MYESIPECANGAILVFVGLLLGRQAFEETKPSHYPALLLSIFPYICNWAKLSNKDEGVLMMGQAGGLLFSFVLTWVFCLCMTANSTRLLCSPLLPSGYRSLACLQVTTWQMKRALKAMSALA